VNRRLILLNLALIVALLFAVNILHERWQEGEARRLKIEREKIAAVPVAPLPPRPMVPPLSSGAYVEVAQKVLFSRDRNPDVIPPPPPPPAPPPKIPPFPAAHGVMLWGNMAPSIILSMGNDEQAVYRAGDKIGEFEIVSIDHQHLILTWNGQTFVKNISDLEALAPAADERQAAANLPPPPVAAPPPAARQNGPGITMDPEGKMKTCDVTDSNPMGTVIDGYKKVPLVNPMAPGGNFCLWQQVN